MCGIAGYFLGQNHESSTRRLYQATRLIAHRGPDDEGYGFIDTASGAVTSMAGPDTPAPLRHQMPDATAGLTVPHNLGLGFRRLSLVDLSPHGHQPFWNRDRTVALTFNGEIYNYVELREQLRREMRFETASDTEVLLNGYLAKGPVFFEQCNGLIAAAIYDGRRRQLLFVRDRIGKSPLYYGFHGGALYWGSEIKVIVDLVGAGRFPVCDQSVRNYLGFGYRDVDNRTFWEGVYTIPAASWAELDLRGAVQPDRLKVHRYWRVPERRLRRRDLSLGEACGRFRRIMAESVRIRARADAPVGIALSGGLDSSTILAEAAEQSSTKLTAYTVKHPGDACDEEPMARQVYERYKSVVDYRVYVPEHKDFWDVADDYIWTQEEPFHSPVAQLFNALFRRARADGFKAMLVGAGGDELFAGYNLYHWPYVRLLAERRHYLELYRVLDREPLRRRHKLGLFRRLVMNPRVAIPQSTQVALFSFDGPDSVRDYFREGFLERCAPCGGPRRDFESLLVDNLTNWLMPYWQRNSNKSHMAVPMEPRSPFLDVNVVEFAFGLPAEYLIHNGWTKYLLRRAMRGRIPDAILWDRTKRGFPFNTRSWFTRSKPIISRILREYEGNPYLDNARIIRDYDELLQRDPNFFWRAVNLNLWLKRVLDRQPLAA